jgi:limonene-1,2-epoxide hydrolase
MSIRSPSKEICTMRQKADPVEVVTRFIEDVINGGKFELVDEIWAKDMAWHGGSLGEFHGLEEWKAFNAASGAGSFIGMHLEIKDVVASGEKASPGVSAPRALALRR